MSTSRESDAPFGSSGLLLGEFARTLDERFRVSIPTELMEVLGAEAVDFVLAKERSGCLSLWRKADWDREIDLGIGLLRQKQVAGKLTDRKGQVQMLGRLLSTRHRPVQLAARGRLLIPEGFREFLKVEAGGDVLIVGAAICVEIWNPGLWLAYLERRMPRFRKLFDRLTT